MFDLRISLIGSFASDATLLNRPELHVAVPTIQGLAIEQRLKAGFESRRGVNKWPFVRAERRRWQAFLVGEVRLGELIHRKTHGHGFPVGCAWSE